MLSQAFGQDARIRSIAGAIGSDAPILMLPAGGHTMTGGLPSAGPPRAASIRFAMAAGVVPHTSPPDLRFREDHKML